jgi:hypothetical protein
MVLVSVDFNDQINLSADCLLQSYTVFLEVATFKKRNHTYWQFITWNTSKCLLVFILSLMKFFLVTFLRSFLTFNTDIVIPKANCFEEKN